MAKRKPKIVPISYRSDLDGKAGVGIIETEDVDEHREAVRPWDLIFRQVSPGRYRAKTVYVSLNGILLYREQCNRRLMVTGATPAGYLMLASPCTAETRIDWCGGDIHAGRLAFGRSSTECECIIPEGSRHAVLLVPDDLALKYLGEQLGSRVSASDCRHLICDPGVGRALVQLVHRLVDEHLQHPESLADQEVRTAIESELMEILLRGIDTMDAEASRVSARARRLAFLRAVKYAQHLPQPIGVAELAAAAGVGRRVLELAFRESLNVAPAHFLRLSRMHGVRQELVSETPDSARVKDIAARWGFSEPGRFAVEYRRLFGESPSETLRRGIRPRPMRFEDALRA